MKHYLHTIPIGVTVGGNQDGSERKSFSTKGVSAHITSHGALKDFAYEQDKYYEVYNFDKE